MDKWTVYVEIDGVVVFEATYHDLASAQMMEERYRYLYRANTVAKVVVGIEQS